jgi:3-deoxy-D-manno-octulosonic acid kinase
MKTQHLIAQPKWQEACQAHWFSAYYWHEIESVQGFATGRNKAYFIEHEQEQWVLRHYYRGGFISRWLRDQYLYLGRARTRSFAEYKALEWMHQQGLPVPKPIAAFCERHGLIYRADILLERLPNCIDLQTWLHKSPLSESQWHQLGATIARFHLAGVYHADLNIKNILWNGETAFLIDFDRGKINQKPGFWQNRNLSRLQRSFVKVRQEHSIYWTPESFAALLEGYQTKMSQG